MDATLLVLLRITGRLVPACTAAAIWMHCGVKGVMVCKNTRLPALQSRAASQAKQIDSRQPKELCRQEDIPFWKRVYNTRIARGIMSLI